MESRVRLGFFFVRVLLSQRVTGPGKVIGVMLHGFRFTSPRLFQPLLRWKQTSENGGGCLDGGADTADYDGGDISCVKLL